MRKYALTTACLMAGLSLHAAVYDLVVISDCDSGNMAPARNVSAGRLDDRWNRRTAYAQTADASSGMKMEFEHPGENMLHRGDRIVLDDSGCIVRTDPQTGALTISGIRHSNILSCVHGGEEAIARKVRRIGELQDSDIYTYVTIEDLDVVFKDGCWSNITETAVSRMDAAATLLRDASAAAIYMPVGTSCAWRRTGKPLPQGNVNVSGIIVREQMRRYGPDMGPYSIRPVFESDIEPRKTKSPWTTLAGWMKPYGSSDNLEFEISGVVSGLFKKGVANDRIYNDTGNLPALLWTDSGAEVKVYSGYNSLTKEKDGLVGNGAIMFVCPSVCWYEWDSASRVTGSRAFHISLNTSKLKGGMLQLDFEWCAGTGDGNKCWYFPVDWKVEYSTDGGQEWRLVRQSATGQYSIMLHSLPWSDAVIKGSGHEFRLQAGYDTAMGPQQHAFTLPDDALGCKELRLRLSPASTWVAKHRVKISDSYRDERVSLSKKELQSWIRFDSIKIDYRK